MNFKEGEGEGSGFQCDPHVLKISRNEAGLLNGARAVDEGPLRHPQHSHHCARESTLDNMATKISWPSVLNPACAGARVNLTPP